jgi:TatD DNase family protein
MSTAARATDSPTTEFVDSHCHLTDPAFAEDLAAVIERARAAGVSRIVAVGGGGPIQASEAAADLAAAHPFLRSTAGIHPHDATSYDDDVERRIVDLVTSGRAVAVGETGLDYYYDHSPRPTQRAALARQLAVARAHGVPIVLHCRDAESDLREVLSVEATPPIHGVVHCFTGTYEDARWYLDVGLAVSFTGILTFKNADALREVARRLPLASLMIETDSPYLAPVPHRGRRNEPAHVVQVAHALAALHSVGIEDVAVATNAVADRLFFRDP